MWHTWAMEENMLLLTNGKILTMNEKREVAQAAIVDGEMFAYVGDPAGAERYLQENEITTFESKDLGGRLVIPGFIDSHMHFIHYVKAKNSVNLFGTGSIAELKERMRHAFLSRPPRGNSFLMGEGWNQEFFTDEKRFPTRYDLDEITTEYPMIIMRTCFHVGVLNSKAMEILGINAESAKEYEDFIEFDHNGEPNGIIKENYLDDIKASIPSAALPELLEDVLQSQNDFFELGITSVHSDDFKYAPENKPYALMERLVALSESGALKLRISEQALLTKQETLDAFFERSAKLPATRDCRITTIKILADGSLGARTAYMLAPYSDAPDTVGIAIYAQKDLDGLVMTAHKNHMPVAIHTIGDGAAEMALTAIEKAHTAIPGTNLRHGLVHCQKMNARQLERMKALGIQAYTQPVFINNDMHIADARLGTERVKDSYMWNSINKLGIAQSFGTDAPVEGLNPLAGIFCAVTRSDFNGQGPFLPEQALDVYDALYAYTAAGAYASGDEGIKGQIAPGMLADFLIMDRDLLNCPKEEILNAKVLCTYLGGNCIFGALPH